MRCVHCHTTETPLWRAGPAGPKTLCNACGVRWKKTGSLIARAKRVANSDASATRKRARTHTNSNSHTATSTSSTAQHQSHPSSTNNQSHTVAPRPVSIFRTSDATRARYDSIFSGLMVVHRKEPPKTSSASSTRNGRHADQHATAPSPATAAAATGTDPLAHTAAALLQQPHAPAPCASPPPLDTDAEPFAPVFVTEVHAPSPSPSPPPMPRVHRFAQGAGFKLCLSVLNEPSNTAAPTS